MERGPGDCVTAVTTLPTGLRVITESVPGSRSASIGVWVSVGSVDEAPALAGASHYLEHLLFKGTQRRDAATIAGLIDMVGGELNAFTAHEYTCYYAHVLADDAARAIDVVCDVVLHARITTRDVDTERSVILDEIAMRDDDPADALAEAFAARLFAGHAVGEPVSGTARSVRGLTRTQIHGYYRRRYDPSRMVIAAAGGVTHREVVRWVREAFAQHDGAARTPAPPRTGSGLAAAKPSVGLLARETEQAQLTIGAPALPRHHPDRFALAVLSTALGGGMSSRLFQRIREEHGLAYTCYSSTSAYADTGCWSVYTACQPANLSAVAELMAGELASVAADGISADELNLAQGQLCGATVLGLEDTESRMNRIGRRALTSRRHVSLDDELAAIRGVTGDQVTAMARTLLARPLTATVCGPYDRLRDLPDSVRMLARRPQWGG